MGQLFSKRNKEVFSAPLGIDNPVTVQVLGICSALAVTAKLEPAIVMGLSVTVITAFANVVISLLRKTVHGKAHQTGEVLSLIQFGVRTGFQYIAGHISIGFLINLRICQ